MRGAKVYVLQWGGNGPCVDGVFLSPEAALIAFNERANTRFYLDRWNSWLDRWDILDAHGGYTHRFVQGFTVGEMAR